MVGSNNLVKKDKILLVAAFAIMLTMAFVQSYKTTQDLRWASEPDFDRDISFVQGTLDGHYGKDPSYRDAYMWYNPLLFSIETAIVKISGAAPNIVVTRAGAYLNLLAPIAFFFMVASLFGWEIALAAMLSYLFLVTGNFMGWGAATYSPWLFPVCFNQTFFYLNIFLCYKAFSTQRYSWFMLLGLGVGVCFLGESAPALLTILILASIQTSYIFKALKEKKYDRIKTFLLQGVLAGTFFILAAMPLLYYVVGKYKLHLINRATFEYTEGIFYISHIKEMVKENISISLLVAIVGFVWFYKNVQQKLIRQLVFNWLFISVFMYGYSTLVAWVDNRYGIHLPGTVPAFHYFFYFKALQSVFYGIGFVFLFSKALDGIVERVKVNSLSVRQWLQGSTSLLVIAVLLCSLIYFPFYIQRPDFVDYRQQAIEKQSDADKMGVYEYILHHIPSDGVILCEKDPSLFPVMPTARKMVSTAFTFSNPYLDFQKREADRENMLLFLKTGEPAFAEKLFKEYDVNYVLLSKKEFGEYKLKPGLLGAVVFENSSYIIFGMSK
jgi:hypothetical protein